FRLGLPSLFAYHRKPLVSKQGTSFATAGAGARNWVYTGKTRSLQTQIAYMQEYKDKRKNNPQVMLDQSLIMISAGTNDYVLALLGQSGGQSVEQVLSATTGAIVKAVQLDRQSLEQVLSAMTGAIVKAVQVSQWESTLVNGSQQLLDRQSPEQVLSATTGAIVKAVQVRQRKSTRVNGSQQQLDREILEQVLSATTGAIVKAVQAELRSVLSATTGAIANAMTKSTMIVDLNAMTKSTMIVVFDVPPLGCIPADLNAMTKSNKIVVCDVPPLGCIPAVRYFKNTPAGQCDEAANKKGSPLPNPHSHQDLNAMTKTTKIVVFDVPPLGCIPAVRYFKKTPAGQCDEAANKLADQHNTGVRVKLDKLRQQGVTNLILFKQSTVYRVKGTTAGGCVSLRVWLCAVMCGGGPAQHGREGEAG
ncbi:unnamed protein product, partial [Closterium sp. Yama58-4]